VDEVAGGPASARARFTLLASKLELSAPSDPRRGRLVSDSWPPSGPTRRGAAAPVDALGVPGVMARRCPGLGHTDITLLGELATQTRSGGLFAAASGHHRPVLAVLHSTACCSTSPIRC